MRKIREIVFVILAVLIAVVIILSIGFYAPTPILPRWEKEKIEEVYYGMWERRSLPAPPLVWYDKNGYVEEENVYRYIGTYGYCYAFLVTGDNINEIFEKVNIPYPIYGLSHMVYYPAEVDIVLYHTQKEFTYEEVYNFKGVEGTYRLCYLASIENREEWLTDAQLERLTRDVEKIAKAHH